MRDRGAYGCSALWSMPTVIQQLEQKGVRGGKSGKPTSNSLSFSISKSVKHGDRPRKTWKEVVDKDMNYDMNYLHLKPSDCMDHIVSGEM